jgi:hypothetical protein
MKRLAIVGLSIVLEVSAAEAANERNAAAPHLVVRTYNSHSVSPDMLAHAMRTVHSLLKSPGLATEWRDCSFVAPPEGACARSIDANEIIVRIVAADAASASSMVLGTTRIGGREPSCLVTVWADRVMTMARTGDVDPGTLLGRAVAHELGHILMGAVAHASVGLMRAEWTDHELRLDRPSDWMFSRIECEAIRRGFRARLNQSEATAETVGDDEAHRRAPSATKDGAVDPSGTPPCHRRFACSGYVGSEASPQTY